ncbi:MAG: 3'-5' exonuclease [Woeseiaceae bacterium]|nr:3'-5' exonuclease [Woeseiaceae bacterium]
MKNADVGQFKVYNLQRQFVAFIETAGLLEEDVPKDRGEVVFYNLGKFSQAISISKAFAFIQVPLKSTSHSQVFFGTTRRAYPEGWQENEFATPDAVQIMTVHQAKGLQWPAVFVPQLVRNRFPSRGGGGRTPWHLIPATRLKTQSRYRGGVEDERRLFYVAISRAQKFLHMTWAPVPGNRRAQNPSDFYNEMLVVEIVKRRRQDFSTREHLGAS